ncbi:MAG TPA: hypothetical protein VHW60_00170 [Caulobacteraceae bacterium]|nr:hypothetical protein [Caulobacteraceae bacterium]
MTTSVAAVATAIVVVIVALAMIHTAGGIDRPLETQPPHVAMTTPAPQQG